VRWLKCSLDEPRRRTRWREGAGSWFIAIRRRSSGPPECGGGNTEPAPQLRKRSRRDIAPRRQMGRSRSTIPEPQRSNAVVIFGSWETAGNAEVDERAPQPRGGVRRGGSLARDGRRRPITLGLRLGPASGPRPNRPCGRVGVVGRTG